MRRLIPLCLLLAACASAPPPALPFDRPLVLLGEVHDNAEGHAWRLRAFEQWLAQGARPVLAMEQFDRNRQAEIERLRAQGADADALIAAVGGPGWHWAYYRPFVALALQYRLPIVAANVSRDEARAVMRDGLAAQGFDAQVPEPVLAALAAQIEASHCGLLDAATARRMALAQVARDQFMARVLTQHDSSGVLLLAGNGHVRTDLGAPRWLDAATRQRSLAVGLLEPGDATTAFDRVVPTEAQPRPDPCEAMRQTRPRPPADAATRQ
jgi:uncharacterized iron-regulated protein